ncbi:hypothetical protein JD276_07965 [Leucobacter sp. CSA1]|uniref:Uncharacterized protein n=1 Tax=Leucobacter chromiisoli TaxID=2796471 RepID=A0A934UU01_9MICO|nr:hypothetical protein [Leucobacter chromiisoli]MBK0418969.1 hypothetical protein [Leucobacter chromiisoli]
MDLKFSFGGSEPEHHDHGAASGTTPDGVPPGGIPLPFSTAPASSSGVLELAVRRSGGTLVAEAVSGDGVTYGRSEVRLGGEDPAALAAAVRSALSRVVAELGVPLAGSVTALTLDLAAAAHPVVAELGFPTHGDPGSAKPRDPGATAVTDTAFQRRTGIAAGTPVRTV